MSGGGDSAEGVMKKRDLLDVWSQLVLHLEPASDYCERWQDRRPSWRHRSEGGFDRRRYEVGPLAELPAKAFVERHHYSGTYVAASQRYGLWERGSLVGVAVLSVPVRHAVLTGPFPDLEPYTESLELGRFVLLDAVPANAESWFLARVFDQAAATGLRGVVSFSDPLARRDRAGHIVFAGHIGTIYQASNAIYAGRGTARSLHLLPDGRSLNARSLAKLRNLERGHEYVEQLLIRWGATPRRGQDPVLWLPQALHLAGVRRVRHPGNHRYLFRIGARRRSVSVGLTARPYPKSLDEVA